MWWKERDASEEERPETDGGYERVFSCLLMTLSLWLKTEESLWNHQSHTRSFHLAAQWLFEASCSVEMTDMWWLLLAWAYNSLLLLSDNSDRYTTFSFPVVMKWFKFAASAKSCVYVLWMNRFIQLLRCCVLTWFSVWSSVILCQTSLVLQHVLKWLKPNSHIISIPFLIFFSFLNEWNVQNQ